ncbi:unnamed protein product [Rhizophagus irregularis]|nr:unnamed protein product [Rhizophagus irregularis]
MDTSALIRNNRKNTVYDKLPTDIAHTRVIYNCDNIETETWDNFRLNIKNQLNNLDQDFLEDSANLAEYSQENIDRYWEKLNGIIINATDIELPKKVLRLHNTFKRSQRMLTNEDAKSRWTIKIAKYNQDYVTSTDDNNKCNIDTHDIFSEEWFDTLKTKVNYRLRAKDVSRNSKKCRNTKFLYAANIFIKSRLQKYKLAEMKSIKDKIDKRVEITQEDQTTWLSNLLDRNTHTNIIIDKVLVNEEPGISTKRLATEPGEVKKAVDNDFARMFRKRNTLLETMTPLWQQIYEPAAHQL